MLGHTDFSRKVGKARIPNQRLCDLTKHFSKSRLRKDDFAFPDLSEANELRRGGP